MESNGIEYLARDISEIFCLKFIFTKLIVYLERKNLFFQIFIFSLENVFPGRFYPIKIVLPLGLLCSNPLCLTAGSQCSSGAREAVNPW